VNASRPEIGGTAPQETVALAPFPPRSGTGRCPPRTWCLVGDAAHTRTFDRIGDELAMEDAIDAGPARSARATAQGARPRLRGERRPEVEAAARGAGELGEWFGRPSVPRPPRADTGRDGVS